MNLFKSKTKRKAMCDLERGDIFKQNIESEAFEVLEIRGRVVTCVSRNMGLKIHYKPMVGFVHLLRNKFKVQKHELKYFK